MSKPFAIVTEASSGIGLEGRVTAMAWIRDRALTLALMAMFLLFLGDSCSPDSRSTTANKRSMDTQRSP